MLYKKSHLRHSRRQLIIQLDYQGQTKILFSFSSVNVYTIKQLQSMTGAYLLIP